MTSFPFLFYYHDTVASYIAKNRTAISVSPPSKSYTCGTGILGIYILANIPEGGNLIHKINLDSQAPTWPVYRDAKNYVFWLVLWRRRLAYPTFCGSAEYIYKALYLRPPHL